MTMILDRHLDTHTCTEYDWKNLNQDRGTENLSPVACLNTATNPTRPNSHNPLQTSCKWSACCVRNAGPHSSAKDITGVHVLLASSTVHWMWQYCMWLNSLKKNETIPLVTAYGTFHKAYPWPESTPWRLSLHFSDQLGPHLRSIIKMESSQLAL